MLAGVMRVSNHIQAIRGRLPSWHG